MAIERLAPADRIMLWPDSIWPQDIGALAFLDGGPLHDADGAFRIEAVREAVAARLHLVPRFRQLLYEPADRLGGPLWVDDPDFDLADHIGVHEVSAPGDESRVLLAIEDLRARRLERTRPLWEMWFLTGMPENRVGLFMRAHHCMADGMAGIAAAGTLFDLDSTPTAAPPAAWTPADWPSERDLVADARHRRLEGRRHRLSQLAHPVNSAQRLCSAWPAVRELIAEEPPPSTSLDLVVGAQRRFALVRGNLDAVMAVARSQGAKVNDVLLAAVAGGLRKLLRSRGELRMDSTVRISVPVTLRRGQPGETMGNMVAEMTVPLPLGLDDSIVRLGRIAGATRIRKARARPSVGKMPHSGLMGRAFLKLITRQRINVSSTDLVGPPVPLYIAGARLVEMFPLLPLIGNVSLGVGAMSYAGQFNVSVVSDRDAYPDLDVFASGVSEEMETLSSAVRSTVRSLETRELETRFANGGVSK